MNTLVVVSAFLLLCLGWAIGIMIVMNQYEALILRKIGNWRSHVSILRAKAKELEQDLRLADAEKAVLQANILTKCANELFADLNKEPRRII